MDTRRFGTMTMRGLHARCAAGAGIAMLSLLAAGAGTAEAARVTYAGTGTRLVGSGGTDLPGQAVPYHFLVRATRTRVTVVTQVTADCKLTLANGSRVDYARAITLEFANVRVRRGGRFASSRARQRSTSGSPLRAAKLQGTIGRDLRGRRSSRSVSGTLEWSLADPRTRATCERTTDAWSAKKVRRFGQRPTALTLGPCTDDGRSQLRRAPMAGSLLVGGRGKSGRPVAMEVVGPPFSDGTPNYPHVSYRQTERDGSFVGRGFLQTPGPHSAVALFAGAADARPAQASCSFTQG